MKTTSTRAGIVLKYGKRDTVAFYQHSDGYPDYTLPRMEQFMRWCESGMIRNDPSQGGGWLIAMGMKERWEFASRYKNDPKMKIDVLIFEPTADKMYGWKVGFIEPCDTKTAYDQEWVYEMDLKEMTLTYWSDPKNKKKLKYGNKEVFYKDD